MDWISVNERLPEHNELVLIVVCVPDAEAKYVEYQKPVVRAARYQKGSWNDGHYGYWNPKYITHWMPPPAPPKE